MKRFYNARHCDESTKRSTRKQSSVNSKERMDCVFAVAVAPLIAMTLILTFAASTASAAELTASRLQEYCAETEKGFAGKPFDASKADNCRGYMMGFFDSIIVTETLIGKPQFCIPPSLPKTYNSTILNSWVIENKSISETTTAAVALFSAYSKAFPCK